MSGQQRKQNQYNNDYFDNFMNRLTLFDDDFSFSPFQMAHNNMQKQFEEMERFMNDQNAQMDNGKGQYYCSSTYTTTVNGMTETKKQVKTNDYEEKEQYKQIGDKKIHAKWNKDRRTGQEDFRRDAVNVQEHEIDDFNKQFDNQMHQFRQQFNNNYGLMGQSNDQSRNSDRLLKGKQSQNKY